MRSSLYSTLIRSQRDHRLRSKPKAIPLATSVGRGRIHLGIVPPSGVLMTSDSSHRLRKFLEMTDNRSMAAVRPAMIVATAEPK